MTAIFISFLLCSVIIQVITLHYLNVIEKFVRDSAFLQKKRICSSFIRKKKNLLIVYYFQFGNPLTHQKNFGLHFNTTKLLSVTSHYLYRTTRSVRVRKKYWRFCFCWSIYRCEFRYKKWRFHLCQFCRLFWPL